MARKSQKLEEAMEEGEMVEKALESESVDSVEMPDPDTAPIKDLTEYCRNVQQTPEGWTTMKAGEKRTAFRRMFCPEKTETFDPNDPFHLISERVENLEHEAILPKIQELSQNVGLNYYELGGVFSLVAAKDWYTEEGFETFKDWVEQKTDVKYIKARYLARIYDKIITLALPWEKVEGIGWSKLMLLLDVINEDNMEEWLKKARMLSWRALKQMIDELKKDSVEDPDEDESDEKMVQFNIRLFASQKETVEESITKMAEESGKNRATSLEWIHASHLAGTIDTEAMTRLAAKAEARAPELPETIEGCSELLLKLLKKIQKLEGSDEAALEVIVGDFETVFPAPISIEVELPE